MKAKTRLILGTTLALPLLAPPVAESEVDMDNETNTSASSTLTENQLDKVTAGRHKYDRPNPPRGKPWNPPKEPCCTVTTMAIGEESGPYPIPYDPLPIE